MCLKSTAYDTLGSSYLLLGFLTILSKRVLVCQAWQYTLATEALRRERQKDCEFKANPGYEILSQKLYNRVHIEIGALEMSCAQCKVKRHLGHVSLSNILVMSSDCL